MKQYQQVIDVMRRNGGYATLGFLNQQVDVSKWPTKTPFASIRRIVQDERFFFKIRPGLWALEESRDEVLKKFRIRDESRQRQEEFSHSYYQGLLVEIGNLRRYETYVPPQDRNKLFLEKPLGTVCSLGEIHIFSFIDTVNRAKSIDVIWFNRRKMPRSFFEVEHSTDMRNSLLKFNELQDFYCSFYIVAPTAKRRDFEAKLRLHSFNDIAKRVSFLGYDELSEIHTNPYKHSNKL